jgi:hypothetical protein
MEIFQEEEPHFCCKGFADHDHETTIIKQASRHSSKQVRGILCYAFEDDSD